MLKNYERAKMMQPEDLAKIVPNYKAQASFKENGVEYRFEYLEEGEKKSKYLLTSYDGKNTETLHEGEKEEPAQPDRLAYSPDGKFTVVSKEHNLWLKEIATGKETQITFDGELHNEYAGRFEGDTTFVTDLRRGQKYPPMVRWSPDGTKFITYRIDQRKVKDLYLLQNVPEDGTMRPKLYTYKYAMPGDEEIPKLELYVFDTKTMKMVRVDMEGLCSSLMPPISPMGDVASWSEEGGLLTFYSISRDFSQVTVYAIEPSTGKTRELFTERSDSFLFFDFMFLLSLEDGSSEHSCMKLSEKHDTLLWYSNRDGWHHYYAYSLKDGHFKNQVTSGEFEVTRINKVDWDGGKLYFTAVGLQKDPYDATFCSVSLTGGEVSVISKEDGYHQVSVSPCGKYYTDFVTETDMEPVLSLRSIDGTLIKELTRCDLGLAKKAGFVTPIRFSAIGADGKTPLFGVLLLPEEAKSGKKVPVLEYVYGGNQTNIVPHTMESVIESPGFIDCTAQLGMATVVIDGRGTPLRGKSFHDYCHKNVGEATCIKDHIAVLKQLAERYPELDIERVGMWGHSGGGFAALHCMTEYEDFYKCAVSSAGNHVQEVYLAEWTERFMNSFDPELWKKQDAEYKVEKLHGPLLLIHGELDDNVHPANTMRVVEQLIKANKDFEFLIVPNYPHGLRPLKYWRRRIFDFFVRNLVGKEPPKEFEL